MQLWLLQVRGSPHPRQLGTARYGFSRPPGTSRSSWRPRSEKHSSSATPERAGFSPRRSLAGTNLTARSDRAGTSQTTGSLTTIDPATTVVDDLPSNFKVRSFFGSMFAASVRRAMCALPITDGSSPKVFEILIRTLLPPALLCTISRRVWLWKLVTCPGSGGCGAVAHVAIHCLPLGFCAVVSNDNSPMRTHINKVANSLFMVHSPKKCLAATGTVRRWIAVAETYSRNPRTMRKVPLSNISQCRSG